MRQRLFLLFEEMNFVETTMIFDYYYGDESNQFSFYRIPRPLIRDKRFKGMSTDAKLLYGLMLDRMSLSAKNRWYDEQSRVYIYYTAEEIREDLCCCYDKALKLLAELDTKKGFGLIERVKQGQGKPTKIYVKRFTTRAIPEEPPQPELPSPPEARGADLDFSHFQTSKKSRSGPRETRGLDLGKIDPNYIKSNQTDFIYTDPSIYPSPSPPAGRWIDRSEQRIEVEENIGYQALCRQFGREDAESVVELMTDVLCSTRPYTMKTEALRRKMGRRSKEETAALEASGKKPMTADQELAAQTGESVATVQRFKTLTKLTPPLQQMVDKGNLPVNTAADIAQMKPKEQDTLADAIEKEAKVPSGTAAKELKEASRAGTLTTEKIQAAVAPTKREETPPLKLTLNEEDLRPYFPDKRTTVPDAKKAIFEGLTLRNKMIERQAAKTKAEKDAKKLSAPVR